MKRREKEAVVVVIEIVVVVVLKMIKMADKKRAFDLCDMVAFVVAFAIAISNYFLNIYFWENFSFYFSLFVAVVAVFLKSNRKISQFLDKNFFLFSILK